MSYPGVFPFISTADKSGSLTKPNGVRTDGERRLRGTGRPCLTSVGSLSLSSLSLGCGSPPERRRKFPVIAPPPLGWCLPVATLSPLDKRLKRFAQTPGQREFCLSVPQRPRTARNKWGPGRHCSLSLEPQAVSLCPFIYIQGSSHKAHSDLAQSLGNRPWVCAT